ncbi:uncharacterized protein LOC111711214 [Eurytemora carolleeae]|uniref:uncharacterized protein LOC111711214 n=1 Tax=Eurytemora carolleeae TaxID=1294199 RepID=UPI000C769533|nr:uncharacterized protein LOC111711214 [Eurytemora carolleeae]|eukprot:XP_023341271.1 uncharacterized protein LOC111711214 [Eurytemora affinis]
MKLCNTETLCKWYLSYDDISEEEGGKGYPAYCTGWIYIVNPGTAARLVNAAQTTKFLWIDDAWVTGYLVKALGFKHLDLSTYFNTVTENGVVIKSVQNPAIYHKDFLAVPNGKNFEISYTLTEYARWCYINKCYNNIYNPQANLSSRDLIADDVIHKIGH